MNKIGLMRRMQAIHTNLLPDKFNTKKLFKRKNSTSITEIVNELSGVELMSRNITHDYLLYCTPLIAPSIVIVGGYTGAILKNFYDFGVRPRKIIIFEPVPEFYLELKGMQQFWENQFQIKIEIICKALFISSQTMKLLQSGDRSTMTFTERKVAKYPEYKGEIEVECFDVEDLNTLLNDSVSFYFNCEGAEYIILDKLLKISKNFVVKTFFIQTHKIGGSPYASLYDMRKLLLNDFHPIVTFDWAWDIWISKKELG